MNQKIVKLLKNITTGMVVAAIALAFLISGIRIFGIQVFGVLTGSMEPTYPTGSLIYVQDVNANDLRVNDVITFSLSPNVIATHRIVEVVPDESNPSVVRFRTKGDANNDVDASLVSAGNIVGKVMFAVPQLGYLASYIQQPPGIYVAIGVCILMVAFVFYTDSLGTDKKNAAGKAAGKPAADFIGIVNRAAVKLLGKPLIKPKKAAPVDAMPYQQGYVPQQPVQQYNYQQQPLYGTQNPYPQQGCGQPVYPQQPVYQQPAPQQYYNPYQQPVPQPVPQQLYPQAYGQQPYSQTPYPAQPQQAYPYAQQGYQPPYPQQTNQANGFHLQGNGYPQQQQEVRRTHRSRQVRS